MASNVFSPASSPLLPLLRLAPLVTSTASLTFAYDQHIFYSPWLQLPSPPSSSSANKETTTLRARYFRICLQRALVVIATLYPLTALFAVANLLTGANGNGGKWYWAGLVFTGAHFALYATRAVRLLEKVRSEGEDGEKGEGKRALG